MSDINDLSSSEDTLLKNFEFKTSNSEGKKVALVIGAGDATGGAIAKRFAQGGYISCMTRRSVEKLQPLIAPYRSVRKTQLVEKLWSQMSSEEIIEVSNLENGENEFVNFINLLEETFNLSSI